MVEGLELGNAPWVWVGGKGGVGKTTVAAALAVEFVGRGEPTLVLSVDPAHSLGDALGSRLGPEPQPVPGVAGLWALELDAEYERGRFLEEQGEKLRALLQRGTYLAGEEVDEFLSLALPGLDEAAAVLRLLRLRRSEEFSRLIIDTAPTGHTLRLLEFPRLLGDWLAALEALEERQQRVAEAFAPVRAAARTSDFLDSLRAEVDALAEQFTDPQRTRFVLVTTAQPVVIAETRRFHQLLRRSGIASGGLVVNRVRSDAGVEGLLGEETDREEQILPVVYLPELAEEPLEIEGLRRLLEQAGHAAAEPVAKRRPTAVLRVTAAWSVPRDRRVYVVGGKGGVGKSTIASALALALGDAGCEVLLLSTDPAGSLAEVWGVAVEHDIVPAPGSSQLSLCQLDAVRAWETFRGAHEAAADQLFAGVLGQGISGAADRRVLQRLLELAPPGVDELMALLEVVDLLEQAAYNAVVLDTAPTGHLLRLLELPHIALDWAHAILRLLLRYREVTGLGPMAERLLAFARSVRKLRQTLQDSEQTLIAAVALPEALSVPETERFLRRLDQLSMPAHMLFVNRLFDSAATIPPERARHAALLLGVGQAPEAVGSPSLHAGPRGAEQLRAFAAAWRRLEMA